MYIDAFTGEVVEQEDQNEIIKKKLYEVGAIDDETYDFLCLYRDIKDQYETLRYKLKVAMQENDYKSWKTDGFSVTYVEEKTPVRFDEKRAKETKLSDLLKILLAQQEKDKDLLEMSVYDYFAKISYVQPSVSIRLKD